MAILVDKDTRVLIQGITGRVGREFCARMLAGGTKVVAGVTPGRAGETVSGVPVFDGAAEAVASTAANAALVLVPALRVLDAVVEAVDAGLRLISVYTEGVPVLHSLTMAEYARGRGSVLIGSNAAGVASPGRANLSDIGDALLRRGRVGIVSKSGTLTYEVMDGLWGLGEGVSTVVCLGGDPVTGLGVGEAVQRFLEDDETECVVMLGEPGGFAELAVCDLAPMAKPVVAYIAGRAAPPGKRFGHAGAIAHQASEDALAKSESLERAGCIVARSVLEIPSRVQAMLKP